MRKIKNTCFSLRLISILVLVLLASSMLIAGKVYQWKDKNGVVHFGDQPEYSDTRKVQINTTAPQDNYLKQRIQNRSKILSTYNDTQAAKVRAAEENSSKAAKKKGRCGRVAKLQKSYTTANQLYSKDSSGKKIVLSAEKKQAAMQEVKQYLAKWCQ